MFFKTRQLLAIVYFFGFGFFCVSLTVKIMWISFVEVSVSFSTAFER